MARYTGPVCKLCRRERMKLFLKGTKCDTAKCPIERRPYPRVTMGGPAGAKAPSTSPSCGRSRRLVGSTACSKSSSARRMPKRSAARA